LQFVEPEGVKPHWTNKQPSFVLRPDHTQQPDLPPVGPYLIDAAGIIEFLVQKTNSRIIVKSPYNGLKARFENPDPFQVDIRIRYTDYTNPGEELDYIVKLTPWVFENLFNVYVFGMDDQGILIRITPLSRDISELQGRVMVEISRYTPDTGERG